MTIRLRSPSRSSAETSPLTPWETEVVTATSSPLACRSRAIAVRNDSFRSTQKSHSAPFSSQPASQPSTASRTRPESAPCEQELRYVAVSKIGNSPRIATSISLPAKVRLPEVLVLEQVCGLPFEHDPARREDVAAMR